jgi:hypothetical protein
MYEPSLKSIYITISFTSSSGTSPLVSNVLKVVSHENRQKETRILALDIDSKTGEARGHGNVDKQGDPRVKL